METSGVGAGDGSGRILARHWLSCSAAVGTRSGAGLGSNSLRGGREPASDRPSPHDGLDRRSRGGPGSRTLPPSCIGAAAPGTGERGPFRSQFEKSRTLPSPSLKKARFGPPRSLPASDWLSRLRLKPLEGWRVFCGRSGRGPLRDQSEKSRVDSGRSLAKRICKHRHLSHCTLQIYVRGSATLILTFLPMKFVSVNAKAAFSPSRVPNSTYPNPFGLWSS